MRIATVILLAFATSFLLADQRGISDEELTEMANVFADCAGLWKVVAMIEEAGGRPASAKQMLDQKNGAIFAAKFLLSIFHQHKTGKQKALGESDLYIQSRMDTIETWLLAQIEHDDPESWEFEMTMCASTVPRQEEIIQEARNSAYRN